MMMRNIIIKQKIHRSAVAGIVLAVTGLFIALPFGHTAVMNIIVSGIRHRPFRNPDLWRNLVITFGMFLCAFGIIISSLQIKNKVIKISNKIIISAAYLYMIIPIFIFFMGFLKLVLGILFSAILLFGFLWHIKHNYKNDAYFEIKIQNLVLVITVVFFWIYLSGIGGFTYQRADWFWRNAVLRDLINFSWPVIYPETGNALVYYYGYWMVPAVFGKIFGWTVANIALYLWSCFGVFISVTLILKLLKIQSFYKTMAVVLAFVLFGRLDVLQNMVINVFSNTEFSNTVFFRFSKHTELVEWVFNQAIVPFVAVPLFLNEKKISSAALLGLCVLPAAPFPFIGLFMIFMLWGICESVKSARNKQIISFIKDVFSIPNLCAVFSIFIVFLFFYASNTATSGSSGLGGIRFGLHGNVVEFDFRFLLWLIIFYIFDYWIFCFLVYKDNKKNSLLYIAFCTLLFIPFIWVGTSWDFCWRASVPAMLLIFILMLKSLLSITTITQIRKCLIVVCFAIGAIPNLNDFSDTFKQIMYSRKYPLLADHLYTFSDKYLGLGFASINYLTSNPSEKSFYKFLGKEKTKNTTSRDIAATRNLQKQRNIFISEGNYYVSPKLYENKFLQAANQSSIENYNGKDLNVADKKSYVTLSIKSYDWRRSVADFNREFNGVYKYFIKFPGNTNLDVPWGKVDEAGSVSSYAPNYQLPQQFQIVAADDYFKIMYGEYALTFNVDDNTVHLSKDMNLDSQLWKFEKKNTYKIIRIDEKLKLRKITDIDNYLNEIRDLRYTVFIAVRDEAAVNLSETTDRLLHELGLELSLLNKVQHAYLAVIDRCELVSEIISERREDAIIDAGQLENGLFYEIESAGLPAGNYCHILINDNEFAVNWRGLNFVVYDNEIGKVVDSVAFDTWAEGTPAYR